MPNWKKVVVSGSDAAFNSVFVTNHVTASGAISSSNSLFFSSSLSSDTSFKTLMYDTSTGKIFHTGSYGGGGGASSSPFTAAGISGSFTEASESFSTRVTTLEAGGGSGAGFPFAGDAVITGSLLISASNNTSSSLIVQGSGSTIFEVQGSQGQLFSITDDLIHSVLEVSDISGDTLFKVSGSGLVEIPVGDLTASSTSTASFGTYVGDGSQLSGISTSLPIKNFANATQFTVTDTTGLLFESVGNITVGFNSGTKKITYTVPSNLLSGSAQIASDISGSFTEASASLSSRVTDNATNLKAITSSLTTTGRMVFVGAGGTLTSEDGFTYNATTNQLAVENLVVTHLTSSFVTASRITTSGSNIFGDDTTDTQTLIGTTLMSGSAQITGSFTVSGSIKTLSTNNKLDLSLGENIFIGQLAGRDASDNRKNTFIGTRAGLTNTSGQNNVAIGTGAGGGLGTNASDQNVFIGYLAGAGNASAPSITARMSDANYNIGMGYEALLYLTSGDSNIGFGFRTMRNISSGKRNISLGEASLYNTSTGDDNIGIGYQAGLNQTTGTGNITIGSGSLGVAGESNQLRIGQGNGDALIHGDMSAKTIDFNVSGSNAFQVIGTEGTLFTVTDSLEGSIFAAKDKTGIPILEVFANTGSTDVVEVNQSNLLIDTGDVIVDTGNIKLSGSLNVTGSHINVADDSKIKLGTGGDLEIYHDGSNSYIDEVGTGTLFYRGGTQTFQNAAGTKTMLTLNAASSVDLRFNNSTKLSTTNTGIEVTGTISGSIISGSHVGDGSQLTGISAGTNLTQSLFVSPSGNDTTAVVGDLAKPFQTILAATASANPGDTIIVYPGTHGVPSQILKDHVNYYFYPGAIVSASNNNAIMGGVAMQFEKINVRGAGSFIGGAVFGTHGGIIDLHVVSQSSHFEYDTITSTKQSTAYNFTMGIESSITTEIEFYVKGNLVQHSGSGGGGLNEVVRLSNGKNRLETAVRAPKATAGTVGIRQYGASGDHYVDADIYMVNGTALYSNNRNIDGFFKGRYEVLSTEQSSYYAVYFGDGYNGFHTIDAEVRGGYYLATGGVTQGGGHIRGNQICHNSPGSAAVVVAGGGNYQLDQYIFSYTGVFSITSDALIKFNGTSRLGAENKLFNITAGKLIYAGSDIDGNNRAVSSIVSGGHLHIDAPLEFDGGDYPSNRFAFNLSGGTLEISNKVTYHHQTTGSGFVDMTGGYLILDGAKLVQDNGTGSFAYAIDLNSGAHSGSIYNNSFTNLRPFGPGSFTNEIIGGGTLFETHKLY